MPAVTDLMIGAGLGQHLVAVSSFDRNRPDCAKLSVVGDYQTVDWEQLAKVRPAVIITFVAPGRLQQGFVEHASRLGIQPVNLPIETIADAERTCLQLGRLTGDLPPAEQAAKQFRLALNQIGTASQGHTPPKVLLVMGEAGNHLAGPGTFLDELLTLAGGTNAAASVSSPYPSLDREAISRLAPEVILILLPGGQSQAAAVRDQWLKRTELPAAIAGRVHVLTGEQVMQPGWSMVGTARAMQEALSAPVNTSANGGR